MDSFAMGRERMVRVIVVLGAILSLCACGRVEEHEYHMNRESPIVLLEGRLLTTNGTPAAGYRYCSNYVPPGKGWTFPEQYDKTDDDGHFRCYGFESEGPLSLWVLDGDDTAQLWKGLSPGDRTLELTLDSEKYLDLPPEWAINGTMIHWAGVQTAVAGGRLDFELPDMDGVPVSLHDERFNDKVVLVNLWGTWCGGCIQELPILIGLKERFRDRAFEIVAISFEEKSERSQTDVVKAFLEEKRFRVNFPVLLGGEMDKEDVEGIVAGIEHFEGYPTTFYIDRSGKVRDIQVGFVCGTKERRDWQEREMIRKIEALLDE